jgi:3-methyladenine DNA glycosylase AlkD
MDAKQLINEVRQFCQSNANAENALKSKRYFKEADAPDSYGLTQVQVNEKAKQMVKTKSFTLETVIEAAPELLKSNKYEEISLALLLVNGFDKQYTPALFDEIGSWFSYSIHNWAHADTLGMFILPKFLLKDIVKEKDFKSWKTSPYKYQRRCVPVTLIKVIKNGGDIQSVIKFLEPLMNDPEREVHQGMGWFLRECWKIKPEETEAFLLKWKEKAPRLIIQYATEKMTAEHKLLFRRSK